jgi:hypothetical protein
MYFFKRACLKLIIVFFFAINLFLAKEVFALDKVYERPLPYWGMSSIETNVLGQNQIFFAHPEATITVKNPAPKTLPELLFNSSCTINALSTVGNCIYFSPYGVNTAGTEIYNSKSYANGFLKSAVGVIRYPERNIIGDSYLDGDFSNFAYWGRHLRQATDSSGSNALWQSGNYSFNPNAQSYWNTEDPNKNSEMTSVITRLVRDSKSPVPSVFSDGSNYVWIPRLFYGVCGQLQNCSEDSLYPEGRIWHPARNKNLLIQSPRVEYSNKGTVLLTSRNLTIETSVEPKYGQSDAALGFIIQNGNVVIRNNTSNTMTVRASMFVPNGTITLTGNRINLIGSFVAQNFIVNSNIANFVQDTRGETSWPPGFRELKLPLVDNN